MANYNELKVRASVIQNETQDGQNTAYRVGSLFYDIIAALADVDGGEGGSTIPSITAAATVNNSAGTPYVNVLRSGADEAPMFTFNFGNLKGATGPQGPQGVKGDPGEGIDAETIQHIEDLEKDLEDLMNTLDTEMKEKVKDLFKDAEFLEELFPDGGGGYSNFGQALNDYTDKYLQVIGMWEEDPTTHQKVYKWSKIQQEYNQIQSRVATLETVAGFPDSYDALVADLIQSVKDEEAFAEFMTGYATVQDVNNVKTVVEWLYSGLRNSTTPDRTISEIVSAGKSALGGAIADVRTYVEKLKSGDYVAKASLAAALTNNDNKVLSDAGVLFTAGLDNSLGTFFAKSSGNIASISALANKLGSIIEISADHIILDGTTWADIINFDQLLSETFDEWSANTVSISASEILVGGTGTKSDMSCAITEDGVAIRGYQTSVYTDSYYTGSGFAVNVGGTPVLCSFTGYEGLILTSGNESANPCITANGKILANSISYIDGTTGLNLGSGMIRLTHDGDDVVTVSANDINITADYDLSVEVANDLRINDGSGWKTAASGTFTSNDGKQVTVVKGIITDIA